MFDRRRPHITGEATPDAADRADVRAGPAPHMHRSPRKPRVGYLLRMYPRFSQTFIVNEILELERQGLDIRIASTRKPTEGRFHELVCRVRAEADYLPETLFGYLGKTCRVHGHLFRQSPERYARALRATLRYAGATWFDFVQAAYLLRWARKKRVDHLHVHFGTEEATVALLAHILGGLSFSLAVHAVDIFRRDVDRALLARKVNASRFTVANTDFNRRFLIENLPHVEASNIRLSYNGVDLDRFKPSDRRRRPCTILAIGRLVEKKGFIHLIHAVRRLCDQGMSLKCKIAGEGPEKRRLKQEIEGHGLASHIVLTGPLQHGQVRELMQRYSCFVLPCVRARDGNMDGIPNVLLEALASGCPVVSTRVSAIPEIIEDGVSGLLVEPGDVQGLAQAVRRILTDGDLAGSLSQSGRRCTEEKFDIVQNIAVMRGWLLAAACGMECEDHPASTRALVDGEEVPGARVFQESGRGPQQDGPVVERPGLPAGASSHHTDHSLLSHEG
ncbi:MAG: glycosyltransferase family 4 protein [Phycisphaerales bacterium]|nr:MAG: glycosyltransferase family 4 protein [Phycisphaerales bacterium]